MTQIRSRLHRKKHGEASQKLEYFRFKGAFEGKAESEKISTSNSHFIMSEVQTLGFIIAVTSHLLQDVP